jgi:lysozyme
MRTFGIDVSHWEGTIDWNIAAPTIGFAYFKCTDGVRFTDNQFNHNLSGCSRAGLPHAPYHYFQPLLDPIAQAEHFIGTAGMNSKRYIVDVEAPEGDLKIVQKLHDFLEQVEKLTNTRPVIYTSAGFWNDYIHPQPSWAGSYELIVAHYTTVHTPLLPHGWKQQIIWQFSDYWNIPGSDAVVDANWFNGSLEQCRQWFGNFRETLPIQPPGIDAFKMRSLFENLHMRQSPNMNARITGNLAKGEVVDVEQLGGNDVWIRHKRGWTCVERGGYRYLEVEK